MPSKDLFQQIKSLPMEEQKLLVNHLIEHLGSEDEDHDIGLYNLDIF